jgi:hypothetical protein
MTSEGRKIETEAKLGHIRSKDGVMPPKKKAGKKRSTARARRSISSVEPEVVGSAAGVPISHRDPAVAAQIRDVLALPRPLVGGEIRDVLEMVILRRIARSQGMQNPTGWITAVHGKLVRGNVTTLRELILEVPTINATLRRAGERMLDVATLSDMMAEVALMIWWPGDPDSEPEPGTDSDEQETGNSRKRKGR